MEDSTTKPFQKPFITKEQRERCVSFDDVRGYMKKKIKYKY
jgi:hypothetical protein